jgi:hypothetical protein
MDGNNWSVLDNQNAQDLNGQSIPKMFECHGNLSVLEFAWRGLSGLYEH